MVNTLLLAAGTIVLIFVVFEGSSILLQRKQFAADAVKEAEFDRRAAAARAARNTPPGSSADRAALS